MASKIQVFMYFVVIASFVSFVNGNKCKFNPAAKVDPKKFFENAPEGGYKIQLSSKVSPEDVAAAAKVKKDQPQNEPKGKSKVCFTYKGKGKMNLQCKCAYDNFAEMDCLCYKPDNVPIIGLPDAGNAKQVISKSDGENYILIEGCAEDFGRIKWMVISKGDLSPENEADIKKFVADKKLNPPADKKDQFKGEAAEIDDGCANFSRDDKKGPAKLGLGFI